MEALVIVREMLRTTVLRHIPFFMMVGIVGCIRGQSVLGTTENERSGFLTLPGKWRKVREQKGRTPLRLNL